jgi:DNA-directed RNA polymerase subunit RPC12/RpoP
MKVYLSNEVKLEYDLEKLYLLFEVDDNFDSSDVIKHSGKYYSIRVTNQSKNYAIAREIEIDTDNEETEYENEITCPVCGYVDNDSWEMSNDTDDDYECGRCGAILEVEKQITVDYSAKVKKLPEIVEVN